MNYVDIIIIIILVFGLFIGWTKGLFKTATDILMLFISMVLASIFKGKLTDIFVKIVPFPELSKNIFSVNIIMYELLMYFAILIFILLIYQILMSRIGLEDKMASSSISSNIIVKSVGSILGVPLTILFLYNVCLVINFPLINVKEIHNSVVISKILSNTMTISNNNYKLYMIEEDANEILYDKSYKNYSTKAKDSAILYQMARNGYKSYDLLEELKSDKKLTTDPYYYKKYLKKQAEKKKKNIKKKTEQESKENSKEENNDQNSGQ